MHFFIRIFHRGEIQPHVLISPCQGIRTDIFLLMAEVMSWDPDTHIPNMGD